MTHIFADFFTTALGIFITEGENQNRHIYDSYFPMFHPIGFPIAEKSSLKKTFTVSDPKTTPCRKLLRDCRRHLLCSEIPYMFEINKRSDHFKVKIVYTVTVHFRKSSSGSDPDPR
jgi:hypothetical protein